MAEMNARGPDVEAKGKPLTGGRDLATVEQKIAALPIEAGQKIMSIIPRNPDEAWRLAEAIVLAGMVPASYESKQADTEKAAKETKAKIMIGIMKGLEIGMAPISALSTIMIVNNRPSVWGDGAKALLFRSGKIEYVKEWMTGTPLEDDWTAHCTIKRIDQAEPFTRSFSVKDAKRAKLWGNPKKPIWYDYPQRMMAARAFSWSARDGASDALFGLSIAEEMQDITPAPTVIDKSFLDDAPLMAGTVSGPEAVTVTGQTFTDPKVGSPADNLFGDLPEQPDPKWVRYVDEAALEIDGAALDDLPPMREGFREEWERTETPEGVRAKITAKLDEREKALTKAKR